MKFGRCPSCKERKVLVRVYHCPCAIPPLHTKIAQFGKCLLPITTVVVRAHGCGRRLEPLDSFDLEGTPA